MTTETPDFTSKYSVLIDHPIAQVFPILAHGDSLESVVRLSALCSGFQLLHPDTVQLDAFTPLSKSHLRTKPAYQHIPDTLSEGLVLPRQSFSLEETVPILFGLTQKKVEIQGTLTWDDDAKVALYETLAGDVETWKLKEFVEVEEDGKVKTRVTETIEGRCPWWMKSFVQKVVTKSHRCVLC